MLHTFLHILITRPLPPESTTPASFKFFNNSGVLSNDALASSITISKNFNISFSFLAAFIASSPLSLTTVKYSSFYWLYNRFICCIRTIF